VFSLSQLIGVPLRKQKLSKHLAEVSTVFKKFQYLVDITLPLGLFLSVNYDQLVEKVYNKPENLEIARKTIINMWERGNK
jgi:hypothetical protein